MIVFVLVLRTVVRFASKSGQNYNYNSTPISTHTKLHHIQAIKKAYMYMGYGKYVYVINMYAFLMCMKTFFLCNACILHNPFTMCAFLN